MKIELKRDCDDNYPDLLIIRFEKLTSWWSPESGCFPGLCTCSKSHSIAWPKDPGGTENPNERSVLDWPATEQPFKNISLRPNQSRRKTTIHLVRTKQHGQLSQQAHNPRAEEVVEESFNKHDVIDKFVDEFAL
ncbi:hypothetical protein ACHWQZ_G005503 [Mnemiopsis leidyi]